MFDDDNDARDYARERALEVLFPDVARAREILEESRAKLNKAYAENDRLAAELRGRGDVSCNAIHCNDDSCQCEPCVMGRIIQRQQNRLAEYQKRMLRAHDLAGKWEHTAEAQSSGLATVLREISKALAGEEDK